VFFFCVDFGFIVGWSSLVLCFVWCLCGGDGGVM